MVVIDTLISRFGVWDYVVFCAVLAVSAGIGLYYAFAKGGQNTTSDFLMGGRQMGILPVSLSLLASFMSAITLLGTPVEVYTYGTQYWFIFLSYCIVIPSAAYIYMPVFYELEVTSAYEYLEVRFNSVVRKCGSAVYIFQMVLYLSVVLYAPALALNQVTGLHVWGSVAAIAIVCTFYTTIGGMKAVMWTDAFQMIVIFASMLAVVIKGCIDIGSLKFLWEKNIEGNRIEFLNFDPNPLVRHTFWTVLFGGYFTWIATYGVNQAQVQRYLSSPSMKTAQIALWFNLLGLTALVSICCFGGLVIYAKYWECDPQKMGLINAPDQLFPLFVMDTLGLLKGMPGLFVAGIFSGALSTVSSGVNSLAAVTLEDFIRPWTKTMNERKATIISKALAGFYGILCFALVAVAENLGNILQAALSIFGMIGGPLLGVFTLGMFFPWANSLGAGISMFVSLAFVLWIGIGAQVNKPFIPKLAVGISGCNATLSSFLNSSTEFSSHSIANNSLSLNLFESDLTTTTSAPLASGSEDFMLYKISYLHYSGIACFTVIILGMLISLVTGLQDPEQLDPRVISPITKKLMCFLPKSVRSNKGVDHRNGVSNISLGQSDFALNGSRDSKDIIGVENPAFGIPKKFDQDGSVTPL